MCYMKLYTTTVLPILVFGLIFTGFSGVVHADKSGSSTASVSSSSTSQSKSASPQVVSASGRTFSKTQLAASPIFSTILSRINDISGQPSVAVHTTSQERPYSPVPFVIAKDSKNTVASTILFQAVQTAYTKIPIRPQSPVIEKDFPFSRPIHISLPVTRGGSVYWFGGKTHNDQFNGDFNMPSNTATSTNMQTWNYSTTNDPWSGRTESAGVYFQGKMYMVSGWNGISGGCSPDVWSSVNGKGWNLSTTTPAWGQIPLGGRSGHSLVVMDTKMYLIGGISCTNQQGFGDVWVTGDGENWTQLTTNNPVIGPRFDHTSVALNNKIYVMGGFKNCDNVQGTCGYRNDVISSVDGINWVIENNHAPWLRRSGHMSFISGGKMYVLGGYSYQIPELGNSSNIWVDPSAPNLVLTNPSGESFPVQPGFYNDVWSSSDGITWTQKTSQAEWIWRREAVGFSIGSAMYVFGGTSQQTYTGFRNDVWKSIDGGSHWQQVSMGPQTHAPVVSHTVIVVPKNFGAGVVGSKPVVQVLRTKLFSQLGLTNLRGQVTTDTMGTKSWFEFIQAPTGGGWGTFMPYSVSQTPQQSILPDSSVTIQDAVTFSENSWNATRIVAKNIIGTVVNEGMNTNIPDCSNGIPHIWLSTPVGAEIMSGLGGETFYQNYPMTVTWGSCNLASNEEITIRLSRYNSSDVFYFTSLNDGSETILVTSANPIIWQGDYLVRVSNASTGYSQSGIIHIAQ